MRRSRPSIPSRPSPRAAEPKARWTSSAWASALAVSASVRAGTSAAALKSGACGGPGEGAHREAVAVGCRQGHLVTVHLDPHAGEEGQRVISTRPRPPPAPRRRQGRFPGTLPLASGIAGAVGTPRRGGWASSKDGATAAHPEPGPPRPRCPPARAGRERAMSTSSRPLTRATPAGGGRRQRPRPVGDLVVVAGDGQPRLGPVHALEAQPRRAWAARAGWARSVRPMPRHRRTGHGQHGTSRTPPGWALCGVTLRRAGDTGMHRRDNAGPSRLVRCGLTRLRRRPEGGTGSVIHRQTGH